MVTPSTPSTPSASSPPAKKPTSRLAITALVLAIFPVCLNLIGLLLGIIAAVRISKRKETLGGMGLAIAAMVVGAAWIPVGGILSAIAIPNFIMFQSRSKQSEAKANLMSLYTAEKSYQAEQDAYSDDFEVIGFSPVTGNRYTYYFGSSTIEATRGEIAPLPSEVTTGVSDHGFVAAAVGNIDQDETVDVWVIDESGTLQNPIDDVHN